MKTKRIVSIFAIVFSVLMATMVQGQATAAGGNAALVFKNGAIHTMDAKGIVVQAIAIKDGKIVFVGTDAQAKDWIGQDTKVIDLQGKLVLPGFFDSHAHAAMGAADTMYSVIIQGLGSQDKYLEAIRSFAKAHPDAAMIKGSGWSNTIFPSTGPTKDVLDAISKQVPISIMSEDGHSYWVNSKALEIAGISKDTPDPANGRIERDAKGNPSGTLRETAAELVTDKLPDYSIKQYEAAILQYQGMALAFGQTAVWDPMPTPNAIEAYKNLAKSGQLKMRVRAGYQAVPEGGTAQILAFAQNREKDSCGDLFLMDSVKIFTDGVVEGTTAYLLQPYEAAANLTAGSRGEPIWNADLLNQTVAAANKAGLKVHIHAIGDAACRESLDAFQYSGKVNGDKDFRNAITHLQLVDHLDIARFKTLHVVAVPDPYWAEKDDYYYNLQLPYLGQARADAEYPIESFFKAGVQVASASDYPVTVPPNPLIGIEVGVTRVTPDVLIASLGMDAKDTKKFKEPLWPAERATVDQMVASYTSMGAYANFLDNETGSLEVGKSADLTVLDKDIYKISSDKIDSAQVLLTFFKGQQVYQSDSAK